MEVQLTYSESFASTRFGSRSAAERAPEAERTASWWWSLAHYFVVPSRFFGSVLLILLFDKT